MTQKELIRQEIERRRHDYGKRMLQPDGMVARAKFDELTGLLAFIDSLPEEKPTLTVEDIKTILDISFWNDDPEKILDEYNRLHQTKA